MRAATVLAAMLAAGAPGCMVVEVHTAAQRSPEPCSFEWDATGFRWIYSCPEARAPAVSAPAGTEPPR